MPPLHPFRQHHTERLNAVELRKSSIKVIPFHPFCFDSLNDSYPFWPIVLPNIARERGVNPLRRTMSHSVRVGQRYKLWLSLG